MPTKTQSNANDYWAQFEGIPLCHAPKTQEEAEALARKGVCGPACA
jgi:hypothetical protein